MSIELPNIIDFLVENSISWFPIILKIVPFSPAKFENGEEKMEKKIVPVEHETYLNKIQAKDKGGKLLFDENGQPVMKDSYVPTMNDWGKLPPEQITRRQNLLLTNANRKLKNQFNYIAIQTDKFMHVDLDCPNYSKVYADLLETHPYFKSATKSFGRHIFITCDKKITNNRPKLFNDAVPEEEAYVGVELLAGQWSYCKIDTPVYNADAKDTYFDFTPYLQVAEQQSKKKSNPAVVIQRQKQNDEGNTDDETKSTDTENTVVAVTEPEIFHQDPKDRIRELVSMITIHRKDRDAWMSVCDCIKAAQLNEGDWLLFAKNNSLNMQKVEKINFWSNARGTKGIYYLYSLANKSSPDKYKAYLEKYRVRLCSPEIQKEIDEMDRDGKIENLGDLYKTTRYKNAKTMLERKFFKLESPMAFVRIDEDDPREEMIFYNEKKFELYCEGKEGIPCFSLVTDGRPKTVSFTKLWRTDTNHRLFSKVVFKPDPSYRHKEHFNLFNGFKLDDKFTDEIIDEEQSTFLQLIKKHCQAPEIYEFVKCWIAHMIQKPHMKTNIAIILYSALGGVGKNCIIDGIKKLLGNKYCGFVSNIKELGKNFNSDLCSKLFIYSDEVCSKAQEMANIIKDNVTRSEVKLEKKGFDPIYMDDTTNYMFTTNNENSFKVDNQDRRLMFIRCLEKRMTPEESTKFYADINDDDTMRKVFNFFKNYKQQYIKEGEQPYKIGQGQVAPLTEYKKSLEYESTPAFVQMLYKSTSIFVRTKFISSDLHKIAVEYARKNYLPSSFTIREFGLAMKKYIDPIKVRGSSGNYYRFGGMIEIRKMLFNADEKYYRYIYQINDDETPTFSNVVVNADGDLVEGIELTDSTERDYYMQKCAIP
jgi:hypothetical protein